MSGRNENILKSIINDTEYLERPYSRIESLLLQLKSLIETIQNSAYKAKGNSTFSALPTTLTQSMNGWVYNVTDAFTTTNLFVEGAGKDYPANTNVVIVNIGTNESPVMKYDLLGAFFDIDALYAAINACYTKAEADSLFVKKDSISIIPEPTAAEITAAIVEIWGS